LSGPQGTQIEDVLFEFVPKLHADGITTRDSEIVAKRVHQFGGATVFAVGPYDCDHEKEPISVELHDSVVKGAYLAAFFLQCAKRAIVRNNEFGPLLVHAYGLEGHIGLPGFAIGLDVAGNFIHGVNTGLNFNGINDSIIRDNYVTDFFLFSHGIAMDGSLLCRALELGLEHQVPDWFECFGASGNLIENNWVTSKGIQTDLYDAPLAEDNIWRNNVCSTTEGEEIEPCIPEP
jgi:hypothetical protein